MNLTPQQEAFVEAYVVTMNATESARLARYEHPSQRGSRLVANVQIRLAIQSRIRAAQKEAGLMSPAELLKKIEAAAFCDPGELSSIQISCCRHCHGQEFAYQWRNEQEWAEAVEKAIAEHESKRATWRKARAPRPPEPALVLPSDKGGFDFDPALLPVEDCTHCDGKGVFQTVFADTRFLSPAARLLYAGVKQTKDGIEILKHDQLKMRELLMRHYGLLNDKFIHITPGGAGAMHVEQAELAQLSNEALEGYERMQMELVAMRESKKDEERTIDVEARIVSP